MISSLGLAYLTQHSPKIPASALQSQSTFTILAAKFCGKQLRMHHMPMKWHFPPTSGFSGTIGLHIPAAESSSLSEKQQEGILRSSPRAKTAIIPKPQRLETPHTRPNSYRLLSCSLFLKMNDDIHISSPNARKARNLASFHVMPLQQAEKYFLASQHVNCSKLLSIFIFSIIPGMCIPEAFRASRKAQNNFQNLGLC